MTSGETSATLPTTAPARPAQLPLPPGPAGHPLWGSLVEVWRDPLKLLVEGQRDYGDVVRFRFATLNYYLLSDPEVIQHVFVKNTKNYEKSRNYKGMKLVLGRGLLTSEGEFWKRQRRLAGPAFHHQHLRSFAATMRTCTRDLLAQWAQREDAAAPFDLQEEMMKVTFRIVGQALFSTDVEGDARAVGQALHVALHFADEYASSILPLPPWVPTPNNRRFVKAKRTLDEVVYRIIDDRRRLLAGGGEGPLDLLGMLMAATDETGKERMTNEELRDEVMTVVLAGHETTANALTWTLYLLSRHPLVEQRLYREIESVLGDRELTFEDLPKLEYCERVILEGMRLFPPAWAFERQALEDDVLGDYRAPAGTIVGVCTYALHRHARFWDNPEGFDPDRFTPERSAGRPRFAYMPFGDGPRVCIGKGFALMEAKIILAMLLQRYRVDLVPGHPIELEARITLRPKQGVLVTTQPRAARAREA